MAVDEVVAERITIPPTSLSLGHLPLHKGGFWGVEDVARNVVEIGERVWYNRSDKFKTW